MRKKKQTNDQNSESLESEQTKPGDSVDTELDEQAVEEITNESVYEQELESVIEDNVDNLQVEVDAKSEEVEPMNQEDEEDQGFDQQAVAPVTQDGSGGKGMAGSAMAISLLALAGTGYNWYDTKSLKDFQSGELSEQVMTDYSAQIETLQLQIQFLTESQQELAAREAPADTSVTNEEASESGQSASTDIQATDLLAETAAVENDVVKEQSEESTDEITVSEEAEPVAAEQPEIEGVEEQVNASATLEETIEPIADVESSSETSAMTAAVVPSSDEIKQIAMREVDAVLTEAKKRLSLNEVAQLLSIGEQRLALAGDVVGAQAAFGIANKRLSAFSDPLVDSVRESVSNSIERLNAVEVIDKNLLTQDLGNLASVVDSLAFKPLETLLDDASETPAEVGEESAELAEAGTEEAQDEVISLEGAGNWIKSLGSKVGNTLGDVGSGIAGDLKDMVRIKKTGPMSDVVLAPEQEYFIRENMKLMLGGAQRAVLQSNTGIFQQNLGQAQSLLGEFFDGNNEAVQSVAGQLSELATMNLEPELPDISNSSASLSEVLKHLASVSGSNSN